jgi:hypothetical protein
MATYTSGAINEVLIGTGVLYVADRTAGSLAFPTDDGAGAFETAAVASASWREIDPIKTIKTAQEARLMGELSQASLKNLSVAMGQSDSFVSEDDSNFASGYDVVNAPLTNEFKELAGLLITEGPAGADRHVQMPRMVSVGAFSMSHAKAPQKVVIATEFKLLVPDAAGLNVGNPGGKYKLFRIVDNTNDSTQYDVN